MASTYPTIKFGSKGEAVSFWQRVIKVDSDGKFGPGTDKATRAWQGSHGLKADGIVGPLTWRKAYEVGAFKSHPVFNYDPNYVATPAQAVAIATAGIPEVPGPKPVSPVKPPPPPDPVPVPPPPPPPQEAGMFAWFTRLPVWAKAAMLVGTVGSGVYWARKSKKAAKA